jgi:hypothetical protein
MPAPNVFEELLTARLSRRNAVRGLAGIVGAGLLPNCALGGTPRGDDEPEPSSLTFKEVKHGSGDKVRVPDGYRADVLVAWGDPLFEKAPAFDVEAQSAATQEQQFGTNADWIAWRPLPGSGAERGLLCINHEFASLYMMVPGLSRDEYLERATREQCELEMAATGHSVIEVARRKGRWHVVQDSTYNRRISALSTRVGFSGPVAGNERLKTKGDPDGELVRTFYNCAGGVTPWGTILICEENFNMHFAGQTDDPSEAKNQKRYQVGDEPFYAWHKHFDQFDAAKEPRSPNRYGWVVEFDPYDPSSLPVKRTALGRFKHESASCALNADGRVVVYSGDDDEHEHVYRFVTRRPWSPGDPAVNHALLDDGELSVARFDEDGSVEWLPLVHGRGPLTKKNGFDDQADVLIETRRAADLLGATRMDRPEDIEVHPYGRVYVMLTKNKRRTEAEPGNPRVDNRTGHVLELVPPSDDHGQADHAARKYSWSVLFLGGDHRKKKADAGRYHPETSKHGWLACPDNAAIDPQGRLWVATDGCPKSAGFADGVWACDLDGPGRALTRRFLRSPVGSEVCGPCFTPDAKTFFVAIQHPGVANKKGKGEGKHTFDDPTSRFPDYDEELPPRAAVMAIVREDDGVIGS